MSKKPYTISARGGQGCFGALHNKPYTIVKRSIDILAGTFGLLVFSIPMAIIMIAIKLESEGPAFFAQERVEKGGKVFRMYKLRTMVKDAERILETDKEMLREYINGGYKIKDDPRITTVGKWIRRLSLDEAPQFINILKGEMSLVGPRAYKPDELEYQQEKHPETIYNVKWLLTVKPGLTGPWQVRGRSEIPFQERVKIDAEYAQKRSLLKDIKIILETPWVVISGKGAY